MCNEQELFIIDHTHNLFICLLCFSVNMPVIQSVLLCNYTVAFVVYVLVFVCIYVLSSMSLNVHMLHHWWVTYMCVFV